MGERFTVNSEPTWNNFIQWARKLYDEYHYLTFDKPRIGPDRSIDQNSLLHVWLTEYAAHLLSKSKKQVTTGELAGMKRAAKGAFYREFKCKWMVEIVINPITKESKSDFTSSKNWSHDEMYEFLTWLQAFALTENDLILESKGKFAKDQREMQR